MKLTGIFPRHIKPVHIGAYEVIDPQSDVRQFAYFDGRAFGFAHPEKPDQDFFNFYAHTNNPLCWTNKLSWRGVQK